MSDEAIPLPKGGIDAKSLYEDIYRLKKEVEVHLRAVATERVIGRCPTPRVLELEFVRTATEPNTLGANVGEVWGLIGKK